MESLSRPLHRRRHSAAKAFSSSFSLKNPYDDVVLSKGGKRKSLEPHEYTEIFSGSSSIPVLDIPGLDEPVGSADCRSSVLDYSNIFGGLRNDDVAVPYEELFSGSAKKTKARIPADFRSPLQQSGSEYSSGNTRSSGEASKQAADEAKQQFNSSFNRTNQRNGNASNGKTHIAQLHAVPGFTFFVDGTPQLQKTDHNRVPSLDCEVSRTCSFSAEVRDVKAKSGLRSDRSHIPDSSPSANEVNLKSRCLKVPPSSSRPLDLSDNKDPRRLRPSNVASVKDASGKIAGECSPPFLDEEFDENSAAAALKKAIEQAQESIRIAKMIMEREKEGREDSSKIRSSGHLKALDKEANVDHAACGSKVNDSKEGCQELDPIFIGIAGNISSLSQNDTLINGGNSKVERATKKVAATKEHGDAFARGDKLFASRSSQSKRIYLVEKVEPEEHGENVKTAEIHGEATAFPGLVTYGECRTANLGAGKLGNDDSIMFSMHELPSKPGMMENGKETLEQRDAAVFHTDRLEVLDGTPERNLSESQKMQGLAKGVGKAEQSWATFSHEEGPEDIVELGERVLYTSQRAQEQEKVVDETVENWRINLEKQVIEDRENDMDQGTRDRKFEECEEMHSVEYLTTMESKFDYFLNESFNLNRNQVLEQEEMEKKSENVSEWNENGHGDRTYDEEENEMRQKEAQLLFESKEVLKEALLEEIYEREPNAFPEMGKFEEKFEAHEPEIDYKKQSHAYDGAEPKFPRKLDQNKIEERHENTSEHETAESRVTEANDAADVQENEAFWDAEGTKMTLIGTGRSEEDHGICEFQEDAYEEDVDKTGTANAAGANVIFSETQETFEADLNNTTEEYQKAVNSNQENDTVPEVTGTISEINGDVEAEQFFHLNRTEIPGMDSLRQSASEETFVDSKLLNAFEGSSDGEIENVGVTDTDPRDKCISSDCKTENVGVTGTDARDKGISSDGKTENDGAVDTDPRAKGGSSDGKTESVGVTDADPREKGHYCDDKSENVGVTDTDPGGKGLSSDSKSKNVGVMDADSKEKFLEEEHIFKTDGEIHDAAQDLAAKIDRKNLPNVLSSDDKKEEFDLTGVRLKSEQSSESDERSTSTCSLETMEAMVEDLEVSNERKCIEEQGEVVCSQLHGEPKEMGKSVETGKTEETSLDIENNIGSHVGTSTMVKKDTKEHRQNFDKHEYQQKECAEEQSEGICSQLHSEPNEMGESMETGKTVEASLETEENKDDLVGTSTTSDKDAKEHVQNFNRRQHQQRIEAIKKGREREKDRKAVERAIREARERAFAEARERAEREKAAAEVRQRVTADAQEKLEKASAVKQPADKASTEAKLRAERAAVERALAEARERALEKALSLKTSAELRTKPDRYPTERFSSSSRNNGLKHSFSSSDLESATNAESAERRKARLERHQRIMERAAKALAEKNMRDLLAQKEQAERNRLAESLDADIKRWAMGKEGNLRALLSTLQYILGQDSGWQPISLTEVITSAAVKKAYRKATLYVHPDKLQQRGASIQQKYICEKVFDLLKAAWNKFNSEET